MKAEDRILYRDSFLLIADKPPGIPVHETKDPKRVNFTGMIQSELNLTSLRTVNRLDLDTSGIVVFGLDPGKNAEIDELMNLSEKFYFTICHGKADKSFRVESFLKDEGKNKVKTVRSGGKKAITEFETLYYDSKKDLSVLKANLITGRRHQIRIHLFEKGYPIAGEKIYTDRKSSSFPRCSLHSWIFKFKDLSGTSHTVRAPVPEDLMKGIPSLKKELADHFFGN